MLDEKDYIMRMVKDFAIAIARIMGFKAENKIEESQQALSETLEEFTGLTIEVMEALPYEILIRKASGTGLLNFAMHIVTLLAVVTILFVKTQMIKSILFYGSIFTLYMSVTINAMVFGNPFHLVTFGALSIFTLVTLLRGKVDGLNLKKGPNTIIAAVRAK